MLIADKELYVWWVNESAFVLGALKFTIFFSAPVIHSLEVLFETIDQVNFLCSSEMFFSCWVTDDNQMGLDQYNREYDQTVQSHSHVQQALGTFLITFYDGGMKGSYTDSEGIMLELWHILCIN